MSTFPHSIGPEQTVAEAHRFMKDNAIRHLPVLHGEALLGLLTLHDVELIEALEDVYSSDIAVAAVMRKDVYAVDAETPLDQVVETLAQNTRDCAIVMHNGHVVGIFTTVDLCRAFADLLFDRLAP